MCHGGVHDADHRAVRPVERLRSTEVGAAAGRGLLLSAIGVALTLPYYGAETFGLHAIGQEALKRGDSTLVSLANSVRFEAGIGFILVGLLLLAVGTALLAIALWRQGGRGRWSGVPLAAAFILYIPQFSTPQAVRVAHGALVLLGCLALARWSVGTGPRSLHVAAGA